MNVDTNGPLLDRAEEGLRATGTRWRPFVSAALIVVATVLVPTSIVGAWTRVQLVDENAFVATLVPLIDEPAVEELLVDETMTALRAQVDMPGVVDAVVDGVIELAPGERTASLLDLLRVPLTDGVDGVIASTVTTAIASDTFASVWEASLRGAHRTLTIASTLDGAGIVRITPRGVGIALGPLVGGAKAALGDRGVGLATLIPDVDRVVIIGSVDSLLAVRASYAAADAIGWWLPLGTLVLLGVGMVVARRRSTAVVGIGSAIALGSASLTVALWLGAAAAGAASTALDISPTVADVIVARLFADMRATAGALTLLGVLTAIAGWLAGRSRSASGLRSAVSGANAVARGHLAAKGVRFGGFGPWLAAHRAAVRVGLVATVVVVLTTMMPLRVDGVVLIVIMALLAAWLLELAQVRPGELLVVRTPDEESRDAETPTGGETADVDTADGRPIAAEAPV